MNFIQEVLNLLDRKQDKKELQLKRDYFEFGRTKPSSVGNPLYSPKMTPHAIRYDDLKCNIISGLVSGTGTEHTLPVFSTTDPANCDVQTIIDSVFAQSSDATLGIVNANLLVKGDTEIEGDLLVRGTQTIIESTIVEIADNIIELNTQGANVDAGFAVGTVNGLKTFGWDATNLLWNTFKESLMTTDIIVNKHLIMDGEEINLITNSVEGLAAEPFDYAIPTTLAVIKYVDENIGGSDYEIVAPDSGPSNFGIIGLTKDGVDDSAIKVVGDQWIKASSTGSELQIIHATPVIATSTANVELTDGSVFAVKNHKYDAAGHIVVEEEVEYELNLAGLGSPVMTSTVTGTGKLWSDVVQAQPAALVSDADQRTYGVQFNDASQLVVNVPWVEGSGSVVVGNPGSPTEDLTSISIDGTVYGISIPSVPTNIVETVDTQNGTYIDMTPTGAADGDVVVTAELSAVDGADTSGRFLSKDNVWSAIPGGNAGTVTSVGLSTDIAAFTVGSSPVTDNGVIELNRNGGTAGQFLRQDGNWADIPSGGTVTTVSTEVTPVLADSIDFTVADPTTTPKLTIDFKGTAGQYISGEGKLETFPTVGSMSSWTIKDGTALGPVLDQAEVQFVGDDKITTKLTDNAGNYILSIDHDDTERIDQTNQLSPAFGDTFKIVDSITQDDQGHPTEVTFLELTLPTPSVGATEAFKTIKVDNAASSNIPGQADVIADSAADTVGYKGGRQIAITTDPTNDIITWDYLRTFIGGGGLIEDVDGALGMEEITITETASTKKLGKGDSFDVEDVTYNNKGQATARETTTYELDILGGGTTNCTFGTTFDNTLIAINGAGSYGLPRPIIAQGGTEFGFRNTSGEPRNYAITYTLEIQGAAGANFYRFETGLAASDTPNNTKIQLINFQEQVYANAESNFSVTFTYYVAGLADQEYIVATINEISALVSCPKAYIAGGSMTVVSSSCDGITDSTMGIIVDRP